MPETPRQPLIPDAYAAMVIAGVLLLDFVVPLPLLPPAGLTAPLTWAGIVLALCGFVLEMRAAQALTAAGTTTRPNASPQALVTSGPYRWSRNPFYCGLLLVLAGACLAVSLEWALLGLPLLWLLLDRLVVPHEEARLAQGFGAEWFTYAGATRRWL
ncbi:isoprenylcysteine carboxylmethyltransferase family protein [Devosia ginsengisoli]|uniref:methyltransferase family protein n=1 Tax=Devosia ginsengisoli TaxID=400770 RepID=UPI0026EE22EF|nr:isoprenylcysteine carboxylmethyltransferase family protein [Devosia ginsengisoli]MCR6670604.1 isoprenylcysteine carboxylmethyltransferase family protein [Devosia ginsengisoli]